MAALLIEEAVLRVCEEADAKVERDRDAWAQAQAAIEAAKK